MVALKGHLTACTAETVVITSSILPAAVRRERSGLLFTPSVVRIEVDAVKLRRTPDVQARDLALFVAVPGDMG